MNGLFNSRSRTGGDATSVTVSAHALPAVPIKQPISRLLDSLWRILVLGNIIFVMMEASRVEQ